MLGETQEQITKLNEIRKKCINPKTKAQKGKKNIGKDEVFSYEKISSMIGKLEMDVNKYKTNIKKFNDSQSIEIMDEMKTSPPSTYALGTSDDGLVQD